MSNKTGFISQPVKADGWQFGLIGWPLEHSISPHLHASALAVQEIPGEYRLYPISLDAFKDDFLVLIILLRKGHLHGLNVTVPYKRSVLPYLDRLTPAAASVRAVNTIYFKDGLLTGDNTDIGGFAAELAQIDIPAAGAAARRAIVLGAGGAARSAVFALLEAGWSVTVAARRLRQAAVLINEFPGRLVCAAPLDETLSWQPADLLVNATPVGMFPVVDASPWPEGSPLPQGALIFDLVYNPPETRFMKMAPGSRNGLGMLVEQAALAFERWSGLSANREAMRRAAEAALDIDKIPA